MISNTILSKILILTFVSVALSQSLVDNDRVVNVETLTRYSSWKAQNLSVFVNDDEKIYRQLVFLDNLQKVNEHNADPNNTYQMTLTPFSDMTEEEFSEKILNEELATPDQNERLSLRPTTDTIDEDGLQLPPIDNDGELPLPKPKPVPIPTSMDWRSKGAVTAVKNQGSCGSCWAFSASGVMESFNFIKNKSLKNFSEQQLVDCVNSSLGYSSKGCKGGWPQHALNYATKYGVLQSSQYAYTAVTGMCKVAAPTSGYYPKSYVQVSNSASGLKSALNVTPVSVVLDASKFGLYGSGIFNSCSTSVKLNHAVLAVGYDSAGNWILKNSWGTGWGESGYMRLKGGNSCGILSSNYRVTA